MVVPMPRIDCRGHGRSAGQHVCIHADAAIAEGRKLSFSTAKHGLLPGTWLCNPCTDELARAITDTDLELFMERITVVCARCAEEWSYRAGA